MFVVAARGRSNTPGQQVDQARAVDTYHRHNRAREAHVFCRSQEHRQIFFHLQQDLADALETRSEVRPLRLGQLEEVFWTRF